MDEGFSSWRAEGHPPAIHYSDAVMESIRRAAVAGLQKVPKRGLEVGGVLFGSQEGHEIRIMEWREIPCEHASGPGFELSGNDQEGLARLMADAAGDPQLQELRPVGWFRTRTRGDVVLCESDIALHNRFFPAPWQVILVLRPHMYEPARAGFFFREEGGEIRTESSYNEFTLEGPKRRPLLGFDPAQPPRRPGEDAGTPWPSPPVAEPGRTPTRGPLPLVPGPEPVRPRRRWRPWVAAFAALVALAVIAVFLGAPVLAPASPRQIALRVRDTEGQLTIEWNHAARAVREAQSATLRIVDGGTAREIRLTPEDLRGGTLTYQRSTGAIELRLVLERPGSMPMSDTARFAGPEPPARQEPALPEQSADELSAEADRLRLELQQEENKATRLRQQVETEARRVESLSVQR